MAARNPELAEQWDIYWSHRLPEGYETALLDAAKSDKAIATRALSGQVIQKLAAIAPFVVGGSADLAPSTNTLIKDGGSIERPKDDRDEPPKDDIFKGRNLHFGIREHAHGRDRQRHDAVRLVARVRRDVPDLLRLHARRRCASRV